VGLVPARRRVVACCVCVALSLALGGCVTAAVPPDVSEGVPPTTTATVQDDASVQYYPSDEPLRLAIEHFNRGHFGIAERYFRDAVEKAPKDASAWIGLAASYDRLGRFDLADRAYAQAIGIVGARPEILNNQGYSYMLRGDYKRAEQTLALAQSKDPSNKFVQSNLLLLHEAARTGKAIE